MSADDEISALIAEADALRRRGRDNAEVWRRIAARTPGHPRVLFHDGIRELEARRPAAAAALFARAGAALPGEAAAPFHEALAHRALGDGASEMAALDRALTIDPDYFLALLGKAMLLEQTQNSLAAARIYKRVLGIAPPDAQLAPALREAVRKARERVAEDAAALEAFLDGQVSGINASGRARECLGILAGTKPIHTQNAELLYFPQLPAIPFYPREYFPWIADLEAATEAIRAEMLTLAREDEQSFVPYVDLPRNEPLGQWAELNQSPRWNACYLWKDGVRLDDHCRWAPRTAGLLADIGQVTIPGFAPTAFFSVLAAGAHLPAHAGSTNARLTVHLPLVLPGPARFRVGNTERAWREGEAWVFDDTIEHEAWNDAAAPRTILIFDVWNPLLTEDEHAMVGALLQARQAYYRQGSLSGG